MRTYLNGLLLVLLSMAGSVHADALDSLHDFVREVKTGKANFTQTVRSPDGVRKKTSSGSFEFARPNRFRFVYAKPFEQTIVGDGQKVWIYDTDLNQVSSRRMNDALGATPAALLAGGDLSKDFELKVLPSAQGLDWVQATPRRRDGSIQQMRIGFKGKELAALDLVDAFGQRSELQFSAVNNNPNLPSDRFKFLMPVGADLIEQ